MTGEPTPGATLHWDARQGFLLDLHAHEGESGILITMGGVPVPADGTVELQGGVELDKLEILFKADVDFSGAPGQLHSARIQAQRSGEVLDLAVTVEDAETGSHRELAVQLPLQIQGDPPAAGGPRAEAATEDELDWDDETTFERMFSDVAPEIEVKSTPEGSGDPGSADRGFAALLQALVSEAPVEETAPAQESERQEPPPDLARLDLTGVGEARELLGFLVEQEQLELEEGADMRPLCEAVAPHLMARRGSWDQKAAAISKAILDHDSVEELYMDDDSLAELLERWM